MLVFGEIFHSQWPWENFKKSFHLSGFQVDFDPLIFFKITFLDNRLRYNIETHTVAYLSQAGSKGIRPPKIPRCNGKMVSGNAYTCGDWV